jgi:hypothetical protein
MSLKASNQIVNALWIGDNLSDLELLTINSFINNGHEFHLWIYDNIKTILPEKIVLKMQVKLFQKIKYLDINIQINLDMEKVL